MGRKHTQTLIRDIQLCLLVQHTGTIIADDQYLIYV